MPGDHGEENTEKRNTTEQNEIDVGQLTQGIKCSGIGMDASDGPTWNSLRDLTGVTPIRRMGSLCG